MCVFFLCLRTKFGSELVLQPQQLGVVSGSKMNVYYSLGPPHPYCTPELVPSFYHYIPIKKKN